MDVTSDIAQQAGRPEAAPPARCPHLIFREVLGAACVAELLAHVGRHEPDFEPAVVRSRQTGERRVDVRQRDCLYLRDLGRFRTMIDRFTRNALAAMLAGLRLRENAVEPREFEICSYGDGGRFGAHVDTNELTDRVRVISCVYYFARTPRAFSGGELRLHGFSVPSARNAPVFVDIAPETDILVAFPSWMRHEVRPVRVPSGLWADRRFTMNCWLLRVNRVGADGQRIEVAKS